MFKWFLSFFQSGSVDDIVSDINRKIAQLSRLEGEKLTEGQDITAAIRALQDKRDAADLEANRARAISQRLEALVKFDVA